MSQQESAAPIAPAASVESAPVIVTEAPVSETPVVTETPVEVATEVEVKPEDVPGSEPSKAVKELIKQRKARQEAEKEAMYWKGRAESQVQPDQPRQPHVTQPDVSQAPQPADFESWEEFEVAKDEYLVAKSKQSLLQELNQQEMQRRVITQQQTFQQKIAEAAKEDPSIALLVSDLTLPIHTKALPIIYESEVAPALLKHLDSNRDEAKRIFGLFNTNPILAVREMTKIEMSIATQPKPEPPKRVSLAPEPIKTVVPTGKTVIEEDSLPTDQWIKRRNENQYKKK